MDPLDNADLSMDIVVTSCKGKSGQQIFTLKFSQSSISIFDHYGSISYPTLVLYLLYWTVAFTREMWDLSRGLVDPFYHYCPCNGCIPFG